tara:strand:- start:347 stop:784 length:438 start_codon:yes stop_codon:yes gene_type:complete
MSEKFKKQPIAWTISLVGLPVMIIILMINAMLGVDFEATKISFIIVISSLSLSIVFIFSNWFFALISLVFLWKDLKGIKKIKFILIAILTNGLAGYPFISLWKDRDIKIISLKGKSKSDVFSVFFFMIVIFSVIVPIFIAQNTIG